MFTAKDSRSNYFDWPRLSPTVQGTDVVQHLSSFSGLIAYSASLCCIL